MPENSTIQVYIQPTPFWKNKKVYIILIGVISLSILIVIGAFRFNRINVNKSPNNPIPNQTIEKQTTKENKQIVGPKGGSNTDRKLEPLPPPMP